MACSVLSYLQFLSQSSLEKLHDEFCSKVFYDPETGFFHKRRDQRGIDYDPPTIGPRLSDIDGHDGYIYISLLNSGLDIGWHFKTAIRADVLAWFYMIGEMPTGHFEYVDGDKSNNVFDNIRFVYANEKPEDQKTLAAKKKDFREFMYYLANCKQ